MLESRRKKITKQRKSRQLIYLFLVVVVFFYQVIQFIKMNSNANISLRKKYNIPKQFSKQFILLIFCTTNVWNGLQNGPSKDQNTKRPKVNNNFLYYSSNYNIKMKIIKWIRKLNGSKGGLIHKQHQQQHSTNNNNKNTRLAS